MGSPIGKEEFLRRAQERFGDKYDYESIVYKSYKTPIKIRCRLHPVKEISITPEKHLQTTGGCKFCLREMRVRMLERELYRDSVERPSLEHQTLQPQSVEERPVHQGEPASGRRYG
jgi:hypothetical protein